MKPASRVIETGAPAEFRPDRPDAHLASVAADGSAAARCSLWWRDTPMFAGTRVGAIGHFSADTVADGVALLRAAQARLAGAGCAHAVGPMDGNTWRSYRLVVEGDAAPPFFLEPRNAAWWPDCFRDAGFGVIATYASGLQEEIELPEAGVSGLERRTAAAGISIRQLDPGQAERDLRAIHAVALSAFQDGFLFAPIGLPEFLERYRPILPHLRPELVLIAEQLGQPVGFLFGVPDRLDASARTAILKTVAVRPDRAHAGLGQLLAARAAGAARRLGYRRAVHALMHEANGSLQWSARHGRVFRRYALFGRAL